MCKRFLKFEKFKFRKQIDRTEKRKMLSSQQSKGTPGQARSPANEVKNLLSPSMSKQAS